MGVVIGETAEIGDDVHALPGRDPGRHRAGARAKRHPTLGNDVIVGAGAQVLGPFRVGDGARIGANAVVLKEVPDGATMVGIPARRQAGAARRARRRRVFVRLWLDRRDSRPDRARAHGVCSTRVLALRARVAELRGDRQRAGGRPTGAPPGARQVSAPAGRGEGSEP